MSATIKIRGAVGKFARAAMSIPARKSVQLRGVSRREFRWHVPRESESERDFIGIARRTQKFRQETREFIFSSSGRRRSGSRREGRAIAGSWRDAGRTTSRSTLIIGISSPASDEPRRPAGSRKTACACSLVCSPANPGGRARQESVMAALLKVSGRRINKFLGKRGTVPFSELRPGEGRRVVSPRTAAITGA